MVMYTLLYLKWITNKHLLYSTWNSAQCYEAAWMGGEFGAEWTHLYVWLSPIAQYKIGEDKGTLLQYSCLENPTDGGAWWAAVHGVARSRTRLSDFTFTFFNSGINRLGKLINLMGLRRIQKADCFNRI